MKQKKSKIFSRTLTTGNSDKIDKTNQYPFMANPRPDNLKVIEGIGVVTEKALNSIGICRFDDFEPYTSETLSQVLFDRAGITLSAASIKNRGWIADAEILARKNINRKSKKFQTTKIQFKPEESVKEHNIQHRKHVSANTTKDVIETAAQTDFDLPEEKRSEQDISSQEVKAPPKIPAVASAVKKESLQKESKQPPGRHKHSRPKGKKRRQKSRLAHERKAGETTASGCSEQNHVEERASQGNATETVIACEPGIRITEVSFRQLESNSRDNSTQRQQLSAEVNFVVTKGKTSKASDNSVPFWLQIHSIEKKSRQALLLGAYTDHLQENQSNYIFNLEFQAPTPGHYELIVAVFSLDADSSIDLHRGPNLRVEA